MTHQHQQATVVVSVPLAEAEVKLRDVECWPRFLIGLEEATKTAYERYLFVVREGRRTREVQVCVVDHPREHRISWRALARPAFDGELRLHPVDDRHTRVTLTLVAEPAGFLAGLSEMVGSSASTATLAVQQLDAFLAPPVQAS